MANWTNVPPTDREYSSYQILRTPPGNGLKCVILNHDVLGVMLHYWHGRSTPCNPTDCPACKDGHRPRWKGYVFVMSCRTRRVAILEFTERVYDTFNDARRRFGTLRGTTVTLTRTGSRANSPLMATFADTLEESDRLPNPEGLTDVLDRMWEVRQQTLQFDRGQMISELASNNGHLPA